MEKSSVNILQNVSFFSFYRRKTVIQIELVMTDFPSSV